MRFRGRARRLQIHRGAADDAVAAWADNGGRIGLIAPERCGRTFLLGRATRTLSRLGTPYVHVDALGLPWGGVVSALDRLGEPPPWEVPADERAAVIAAQLHRHCLTGLRLIVDDVERQDPGTLRVLDRLADLGASMLVAGTRGPAWASRLVDIPPLASATDLLEAALRDRSAAEQLAGPASRTCEGAPGRVLDWLERALVAGAIAPRAGRWEVRAELLPTDAAPAPIPDDAAEFGALAAASRASMPASLLAQALGADLADVMRAIESLADRALVRFSGDLVTPTGPRAVELLRSAKAPSSALVALCERELERPGGDVIRAAWLAIESERPDVLGRAAPAAARRAAEEDPSLADPLLQALAERVSDPVVDAARVAQLRRQGRPHDAIALARSGVADRPWQRADAPVLLELGRIYEQHGDTESALRCVELLRTVAGPDAAPIETAMLEARLLLATGRSREALVAALPATRREPGPGERSAWTSLHLVAIAALEANGDDEGTAALLASLDLDALVGRDGVLLRAARARLIGRTEDAERAASELERMSNAPGLRRAERAELLRDSARARS